MAERWTEAPALILPTQTIPYGELHQWFSGVAAHFSNFDVGRGDRVVLMVRRPDEMARLLLGTMVMATAVPMRVTAGQEAIAQVVHQLQPRAVVCEPEAAAAWASLGVRVLTPTEVVLPVPSLDWPESAGGGDAEAVIVATSGTTGLPRYVVRSHRMVLAAYGHSGRSSAARAATRVVVTAPPASAMVQATVFATLLGGGAVIFPAVGDQGVPTPGAVLEAWRRHGATRIAGTPAFLRALLDLAGGTDLPPLDEIVASGASIDPPLVARLQERFGAQVINGYGLTEAPGLARSIGDPGMVAEGWMLPTPGRDLAVVDMQGEPVSPEVEGEIVTRGPHVFTGYLGDPEATREAFTADGWFRTGDLGIMDGRGMLRITGRLNEVINRGGEKIAPDEVESILLGCPGVADAAVFAVDDDRLGEEIAAIVKLQAGAAVDLRTVRRHLLERLPASRVPREMVIVTEIPRNASGKVMRSLLSAAHRGKGS